MGGATQTTPQASTPRSLHTEVRPTQVQLLAARTEVLVALRQESAVQRQSTEELDGDSATADLTLERTQGHLWRWSLPSLVTNQNRRKMCLRLFKLFLDLPQTPLPPLHLSHLIRRIVTIHARMCVAAPMARGWCYRRHYSCIKKAAQRTRSIVGPLSSLSLSPLSLSLSLSPSLPSHLPRPNLAHTQSHTLARTLTRTRTLVNYPAAFTSLLFFPRRLLFLRVFCPFPRLPVYTRNQADLYPSVMPSSKPSAGRPVGVGCFQASACCPPLLPFSSPYGSPPSRLPPRCPHKTNLKIVADSAGGLENPNETIERTPDGHAVA